MHTALFILYFFLLCLVLTRMRFFTSSIRPVWLVMLFGIHVAAGCLHTWLAFRFYPHHGDIWLFFEESIGLKHQLLTQPAQFFANAFSAAEFNITDGGKPVLDFQYKVLQYLNTFLNLASFDNLYINTLLFSFPVFGGTIALFKIFYTAFGKPLPAFCTLLLPSLLFWTSVVYKDGLFYMAIGYFLYYFLQPGRPAFRKGILTLLFFTIMILSRANALFSLLPALLFFFLAEKKSMGKGRALVLSLAMVVVILIVFNALLEGGLLTRICDRQRDFQALTGGSRIYLPSLLPSAGSFLAVFPLALVNGFFQPFPGAGGKSIYTAFSIELLFIWLIILFACCLLARKKAIRLSNFDIACLLFSLPGMMIIGYMVPFAGAIVRYRSIYLCFLLAPFVKIICQYPFPAIQALNNWLCRKVVVINP